MVTTPESTIVFLGPSLDIEEAKKHLQACYLPPIRRGDLPRAVEDGARSIGIVDGEFGQSLAVSVMEVGAALKRGAKIWGAASMGALRAAECQSMGMTGVGWIFQGFADGRLNADDEVALLFDPWSHRATTIPLVNVRWSLLLAIEEGVIPDSSELELIELARKMRFVARTHQSLLEAASGSQLEQPMRSLVDFMKRDPLRTDRKRLDALLLLENMRERIALSETVSQPSV